MKNPAEKSEKDLEAALGSLINLVKSKSSSHTYFLKVFEITLYIKYSSFKKGISFSNSSVNQRVYFIFKPSKILKQTLLKSKAAVIISPDFSDFTS